MPQEVLDIDIAIIGAGPAGLMAAEVCSQAGKKTHIFEAMPTPARKFLMAGKSGLNITHSETFEKFLNRYSEGKTELKPALLAFTNADTCSWVEDLGIELFTGSSGRVFPKAMKASPLLRAWLKRIATYGATLHTKHKWINWQDDCLTFETTEGAKLVRAKATIFALGGASWPKLGSTGAWQTTFANESIAIAPFKPSNCGLNVNWSPFMKEKHAGSPIKSTVLSIGDKHVKGDFVISHYGVEGSAIYALSSPVRHQLEQQGKATLNIDLTPDRNIERLQEAIEKPKGKKSFATFLKKSTGLSGAKAALLRENIDQDTLSSPSKLAARIKSVPLTIVSTRSTQESISVAGGIEWLGLNEHLMLSSKPGVFCAGEMLNWDAPTGGYLITACLAQGKQAANAALNWLSVK